MKKANTHSSMTIRHYSPFDRLVLQVDQGLRTLFGAPITTTRLNPSAAQPESILAPSQRQHAAGLMRVNHAGEVAAQALYQGQALTARRPKVQARLEQSAQEENDHLQWCEERLKAFNSHKSYFNPLWYIGSLAIGAIAGLAGDRWSLGFVVETERQVVEHLKSHLQKLPIEDKKSRAVLSQMQDDEGHHAIVALEAGGAELPVPIKVVMRFMSQVMTKTAYYF